MTTLRVLLVATTIGAIACPVGADIVTIGDPEDGSSFTQAWNQAGVGSFDFMALMSLENTFQGDPAVFGLSSGWTVDFQNDTAFPTVVTFSGPAVASLNFTTRFQGSSGDHTEFAIVTFLGDTLLESGIISRNPGLVVPGAFNYNPGGGWSGSVGTGDPFWEPPNPSAIPAPGAFLLALLGLPVIGWLRRRFA